MTKIAYGSTGADNQNAIILGNRLNTEAMMDEYSAYTYKVYNPIILMLSFRERLFRRARWAK